MLTAKQVLILRIAAIGVSAVWCSETRPNEGRSFHGSAAFGEDITNDVRPLVDRDVPLLRLGERDCSGRDWLITAAGRDELAKHPEES